MVDLDLQINNPMRCIQPFETTWTDYPDNYSQAILIYTIGCEHNCKGCQNPALQHIYYNIRSTFFYFNYKELQNHIVKFSEKHNTNKVVFSGGDPLFISNINILRDFLNNNKDFDVCIYTGYTIENVKELGIKNFKFIKCNKYNSKMKQVSNKTDTYISFASSNQQLYDSDYKLISSDGIYYF